VRASVESGADFGDGVEVSGLAGLSYRVDGSLTVAGGVLAGSRIEDDARVVPLIGFDWAFAEGWRLSSFVGRGRPADRAALSGGLSVDLSYEWCDAATVFVRGVYESERFALDDDNAASPGGVFDREAVSVTGGVDWTLGPGIDLRVFGGVSVYQELDFEDGGGRDVASSETDPQPSVGATLVWRF
jgi:hypothetical protein